MKVPLHAALALSIILWASSFPGIKVGLKGYTPVELATLRLFVASFVLALIASAFKVRIPRREDLPLLLCLGLIGVSCYHVAVNYGELWTSSNTAAFLACLSPVFTVLFAWLFLAEKLSLRQLLGITLGLLGVWIIVWSQGGSLTIHGGALLLLVSALVWGLFSILQKPLLLLYSPLEVTCYAVWGGTMFLTPFLFQLVSALQMTSWPSTISAIYLGTFPTALAYVSWSYVLANMPASRAAVYTYLVPVLSAFLAHFSVNETPTLWFVVGALAVLLGVNVAQKYASVGLESVPRNQRASP